MVARSLSQVTKKSGPCEGSAHNVEAVLLFVGLCGDHLHLSADCDVHHDRVLDVLVSEGCRYIPFASQCLDMCCPSCTRQPYRKVLTFKQQAACLL